MQDNHEPRFDYLKIPTMFFALNVKLTLQYINLHSISFHCIVTNEITHPFYLFIFDIEVDGLWKNVM